MHQVAHLDVESRSLVDLKKAGLYKYWEHESTEILVVRWRIGDRRGNQDDLAPFIKHVAEGGVVTGHNIAFDRTGWNAKLARLNRWHEIKVDQSDCTMARCAALALPQSLDQAAKAAKVSIQKDDEGRRLMLRMCKPKKIVDGVPEWRESPEEIQRLGEYCATDVEAEACMDAVLPPLTPLQRRTWILDQTINERGVMIDLQFAERALVFAQALTAKADKQIKALTGGAVTRTTQVARITDWLKSRGIPCASLGKGVVDDVVVTAEVLSDDVALQVIELRRASAKSSVAKYRAMIESACADHRVRGTLNYHGASTGRWAGRLIQPQNFPRVSEEDAVAVEQLHSLVGYPNADLSVFFENPLEVLSKALRSAIIAAPGHRLIGGDFSNIEGRVNAWLAGEDWKVKAFADFDAGTGHDLYVLSYANAFDMDPRNVDKAQRQRGKTMELALGYQGGKRAFQKMAANVGLSVSDETADELKVAWREAHPAIRQSWYELQDAAIEAVKYKGSTVKCLNDRIQYKVAKDILWCRLPSGRCLAYVHPFITNQVFVNEDGEEEVTDRPQVAFWGTESTTKKWCVQRLYGGRQCENFVQAIAYDLLVEGMFRVEAAGYPIVLTVHDEILAEVPDGFGSVEEFEQLMVPDVEWAAGLPIAVGAWEGKRYVK